MINLNNMIVFIYNMWLLKPTRYNWFFELLIARLSAQICVVCKSEWKSPHSTQIHLECAEFVRNSAESAWFRMVPCGLSGVHGAIKAVRWESVPSVDMFYTMLFIKAIDIWTYMTSATFVHFIPLFWSAWCRFFGCAAWPSSAIKAVRWESVPSGENLCCQVLWNCPTAPYKPTKHGGIFWDRYTVCHFGCIGLGETYWARLSRYTVAVRWTMSVATV